jgi:hypothetical protein
VRALHLWGQVLTVSSRLLYLGPLTLRKEVLTLWDPWEALCKGPHGKSYKWAIGRKSSSLSQACKLCRHCLHLNCSLWASLSQSCPVETPENHFQNLRMRRWPTKTMRIRFCSFKFFVICYIYRLIINIPCLMISLIFVGCFCFLSYYFHCLNGQWISLDYIITFKYHHPITFLYYSRFVCSRPLQISEVLKLWL